MKRKILALTPFFLILLLIFLFYLTNAYHFISFQTIQQEHLKWKAFVDTHPILSAIYFMGIYIVSVVLVIPDSTILSLLGGFLFPMPLALVYACISETIGATLFFVATRLAFMETLGAKLKKKSRWNEMEQKFQSDQACYLLFLRFSHLLPFWIVNLGAGLLQVKIKTFIWTTFVGVLPLTYFLTEGGASLSSYFETHTFFMLKDIFTTQLKIALIVLGCFALLPIIYKKCRDHFRSK